MWITACVRSLSLSLSSSLLLSGLLFIHSSQHIFFFNEIVLDVSLQKCRIQRSLDVRGVRAESCFVVVGHKRVKDIMIQYFDIAVIFCVTLYCACLVVDLQRRHFAPSWP